MAKRKNEQPEVAWPADDPEIPEDLRSILALLVQAAMPVTEQAIELLAARAEKVLGPRRK
jgi:hypothetical protein